MLFIRQNGSASGARPNPQGSFHYGSINITDTYILRSMPPVVINGKTRATFNGISFANPDTPIRLADQYKVQGAYKLDFPSAPLTGPPRVDRSVINATYKGFIEVILQNNDTVPQSFHMDGYGFFVVGYVSFLTYHMEVTIQIICVHDYNPFSTMAGWLMGIGQKTAEIHMISGMQ